MHTCYTRIHEITHRHLHLIHVTHVLHAFNVELVTSLYHKLTNSREI